MIKRNMYIGYAAEGFSGTHPRLARYKNLLFLYIEGEEKPEDVFSEDLIPFPDGKLWHPMTDVFHYSRPLSEDHWKRKKTNKKAQFYVAYLKPELISQYVYYHYLLQEGKPGLCDKYGMIFLYENLLIMYLEYPRENETEKYNGKLESQMVPDDMSQHVDECFQLHEDIEYPWKEIDSGLLRFER